jgi:cytochrome c-type biogenesis protein CcsB
LDLIFFKAAVVLYFMSSAAYSAFLIGEGKLVIPFAIGAAVLGMSCHTLSILHRALFSGYFPLTTFFDAISFFSWLVVGMFLAIRMREPSPILAAIAAPLATAAMLYAWTLSYQTQQPVAPVLRSWWLPVHATLAVAGNGVLAVTAMGGFMYVIQERLIKTKQIGRFHRLLPSLQMLDTINRHGLALGFFLLTLGIISGALWAGAAWGSYWSWDPKETWSLVTWLVYAAIIHLRFGAGLRGRRAALLAMFGFALVLFTFLGVSVLMKGHHSASGGL